MNDQTFAPLFDDLADLLQRRAGLGWGRGGRVRLREAVAARAAALGLAGPGEYMAHLREDETEWRRFLPRLTNRETRFFRNPAQFEALTPLLEDLAHRREERRLNLCSIGCSTGQEALSLAMAAYESGLINKNWEISVFAADIDYEALDILRGATYDGREAAAVGERHLSRWFLPKGERRRVRPELMDRLLIGEFNLLDLETWPWPDLLGRMDLVMVKNVLGELDPSSTGHAVRRLADITAPEGLVFIGATEGLVHAERHFRPERLGGAVYFRRVTAKLKVNPGHVTRKARQPGGEGTMPFPPASEAARPNKKLRGIIGAAAKKMAEDRPDEALPRLEKSMDRAAEKGRLCTRSLALAAAARLMMGRAGEAAAMTDRIIDLDVETPWVQFVRARALAASDRKDEAADAAGRALEQLRADPAWAGDDYWGWDPASSRFSRPAEAVKHVLENL